MSEKNIGIVKIVAIAFVVGALAGWLFSRAGRGKDADAAPVVRIAEPAAEEMRGGLSPDAAQDFMRPSVPSDAFADDAAAQSAGGSVSAGAIEADEAEAASPDVEWIISPMGARLRVMGRNFYFEHDVDGILATRLEPGFYHVEVSCDGYETFEESRVTLGGSIREKKIALRKIESRPEDVADEAAQEGVGKPSRMASPIAFAPSVSEKARRRPLTLGDDAASASSVARMGEGNVTSVLSLGEDPQDEELRRSAPARETAAAQALARSAESPAAASAQRPGAAPQAGPSDAPGFVADDSKLKPAQEKAEVAQISQPQPKPRPQPAPKPQPARVAKKPQAKPAPPAKAASERTIVAVRSSVKDDAHIERAAKMLVFDNGYTMPMSGMSMTIPRDFPEWGRVTLKVRNYGPIASADRARKIEFVASPLPFHFRLLGAPKGAEVWLLGDNDGKATFIGDADNRFSCEAFKSARLELRCIGHTNGRIDVTARGPNAEGTIDASRVLGNLPTSAQAGSSRNLYCGGGRYVGMTRIGARRIRMPADGAGREMQTFVIPEGFWLVDKNASRADVAAIEKAIPGCVIRDANKIELECISEQLGETITSALVCYRPSGRTWK